jgi:hypothetical protein
MRLLPASARRRVWLRPKLRWIDPKPMRQASWSATVTSPAEDRPNAADPRNPSLTKISLQKFVFCALIPLVFHKPTEPVEALPQPQRSVPGRIGQLLGMVHTLIAYGKNLAATLRLRAPAPHLLPCFDFVALAFDTSNLPLILNRITRGLLRAMALQERLRQRAARRQDFKARPGPRRPPSSRQPRGASPKPAPRLHNPARNRFIAGRRHSRKSPPRTAAVRLPPFSTISASISASTLRSWTIWRGSSCAATSSIIAAIWSPSSPAAGTALPFPPPTPASIPSPLPASR